MGKQKRVKKKSKFKYPALDQHYYNEIRKQYFECDYVDKLTDKQKAWLNAFNEETLNANFQHSGKKIIKGKKKKRAIYNENNSRNRDLFAITRATGYLETGIELPEILEKENNPNDQEDIMNSLIDLKNLKK